MLLIFPNWLWCWSCEKKVVVIYAVEIYFIFLLSLAHWFPANIPPCTLFKHGLRHLFSYFKAKSKWMLLIAFSKAPNSCTNWCCCKGNDQDIPAIKPQMTTSHSNLCVPAACRKVRGVSAAFFMSLDCCSILHSYTHRRWWSMIMLLISNYLISPQSFPKMMRSSQSKNVYTMESTSYIGSRMFSNLTYNRDIKGMNFTIPYFIRKAIVCDKISLDWIFITKNSMACQKWPKIHGHIYPAAWSFLETSMTPWPNYSWALCFRLLMIATRDNQSI